MSDGSILREGWRYSLVGALCAAGHNVIMIAGDWLGHHYLAASVASLLIVTPMGYLLHCGFTFGERFSWGSFLRFSAGTLAAYPLSLGLTALFHDGLGLAIAVSVPLATLGLFLYNFLAARWAISRRLLTLRPKRMNRSAAAERA